MYFFPFVQGTEGDKGKAIYTKTTDKPLKTRTYITKNSHVPEEKKPLTQIVFACSAALGPSLLLLATLAIIRPGHGVDETQLPALEPELVAVDGVVEVLPDGDDVNGSDGLVNDVAAVRVGLLRAVLGDTGRVDGESLP